MSAPVLEMLLKQLDGGNLRMVAALAPRLTDAERRRLGEDLPGLLRDVQDRQPGFSWSWSMERHKWAFMAAGAGGIGGAAAAAAWLTRRDLRVPSSDGEPAHALRVVAAAAGRPAAWRAEVARRLAGRLAVADQADPHGNAAAWRICALLSADAGAGPPDDDAFAVGWANWTDPEELAGDPFLGAMLPRLFEIEIIGRVLGGTYQGRPWIDALTALARAGGIDRTALLDGCLRRLLRGGDLADLRWYVRLHEALAVTPEEAAERLRDYLRLLPAAPAGVAELALTEVRRADRLGALDGAAFAEAAEALLFRPEKKLVRAALIWLGGSARERSRVDATLAALPVAFGCEAHALQERAVEVAVKHAAEAGEKARQAVREAAAALPADLRAWVAAAFGDVEAPEPAAPVVLAPPPPPALLPGPISSIAELAEQFAVLERTDPSWQDVERVLAGIVEFGYRDPDGVRAALGPFVEDESDIWNQPVDFGWYFAAWPAVWPKLAARAIVEPDAPFPRVDRVTGSFHAPLRRFLLLRMREIAALAGRVPVVLGTPTSSTGHIDPDELVSRMERVEAAGADPGPFDLQQALLRLPREAGADAAARARRLASPAGRELADRLAGGPVPDPAVECVLLQGARSAGDAGSGLVATVTPRGEVPDPVAPLFAFPWGSSWQSHSEGEHPQAAPEIHWWPAMLPSHTETAAAHLLPHLAPLVEADHEQGAALLGLAEADGPAGAAAGAALAYGLTVKSARQRAGAVDALLHMAARGRLPAAELGAAVGTLTEHRIAKPARVTGALAEAAGAGADAQVWTAVAAALPVIFAAIAEQKIKPPAGLPDLIALGTRTAEATGARDGVPGLAETVGRGGSSRLVKEAARLYAHLTRW
ncbi:DUF6493 family protein [Spirillospora sp. NPDC029432]|uniref:DUF6493 family protein n=1 Tax=Spirillospora sp. NPDC029432 TaxID=3154599 RepID=UPI0034565F87